MNVLKSAARRTANLVMLCTSTTVLARTLMLVLLKEGCIAELKSISILLEARNQQVLLNIEDLAIVPLPLTSSIEGTMLLTLVSEKALLLIK